MRCSHALLLLASVTIGHAAAGPVGHIHHRHIHDKKHTNLDVEAAIKQRDLAKRELVIVTKWVTEYYDPTQPTEAPGILVQLPASSAVPTTAPAPAVTPTTLVPVVVPTTSTPAPPPPAPTTSVAAAPPPPPPAASSSAAPVTGGSSSSLSAADLSKLKSMGVAAPGVNAGGSNGGVWLGSDGPYTNQFVNGAGQPLILVMWGDAGSWVNVKSPLITISLPVGASTTVSMATGFSGAWAAVYGDTALVNGQVSNVWGEITTGFYGAYDVSYEPKMSGHPMSIVGPKCTSDATRCVFKCLGGVDSCTTGYDLINCAAGSQVGAQYGTYAGAASGGCGFFANSAALTTTFL